MVVDRCRRRPAGRSSCRRPGRAGSAPRSRLPAERRASAPRCSSWPHATPQGAPGLSTNVDSCCPGYGRRSAASTLSSCCLAVVSSCAIAFTESSTAHGGRLRRASVDRR
jgi:hypothetical protein